MRLLEKRESARKAEVRNEALRPAAWAKKAPAGVSGVGPTGLLHDTAADCLGL